MLKFRRLTENELKSFRKQFIAFLEKNNLNQNDWMLMQRREPSKARILIDIFSDMVFYSILSKSACMERLSTKEFKSYRFFKDKVIAICAKIKEDSPHSFNKDNLNEVLGKTLLNDNLEVLKAEKSFEKSREQEMFRFLNDGCYPADDSNYELLADWIS